MAMIHSLPQAPHMLWQTAASPALLPNNWQQRYRQCPRCGGNAPNVCDEIWPESWWEDDMLGLMYQGHIPPRNRIPPWDSYYTSFRIQYPSATSPPSRLPMTLPEPGYIQNTEFRPQVRPLMSFAWVNLCKICRISVAIGLGPPTVA
jgi:hypothetical protein